MARKTRRKFGPQINFRNLTYAPVNELGVVFLFGLLHESLGLHVESVQAGFPDCYAKKQLNNGAWEEVLIEFEYESKSFLTHKHNPENVDMVICWIDNWPDPPKHIEIVALSEVLKEIGSDFELPPKYKQLSEWQKFSQEKRLEGYNFSEIGEMWRNLKNGKVQG